VVALREIAEETVNLAGLMESLVKGLQRQVEVDEPEEEILEVMADEQALAQAMMAGAAQAAEAADEDVSEVPDAELGDDTGEDRA
jgi:DNA-directed RNA polymerase subunit omega